MRPFNPDLNRVFPWIFKALSIAVVSNDCSLACLLRKQTTKLARKNYKEYYWYSIVLFVD